VKEYLERGTHGDRDKKDKRVPLVGDLDIADKVAKMGRSRGYKEAYRNIVLSFGEEELPVETLERVAEDFIKLYLAGYEEDEHSAYAEAHLPKIKINERGEKRHPHIHIVIPTFSPKLNHRLELGDHARRKREIELIKEWIETKYGLKRLERHRVVSQERSEIRNFATLKSRTERKKALEEYIYANLERYGSFGDMVKDLERFGEVKVSKRAKTPYVSVKVGGKAVRLKGGLFNPEEFEKAKLAILRGENSYRSPAEGRSLEEIERELEEIQKGRIERIAKRTSKARAKAKAEMEETAQAEKDEREEKGSISYPIPSKLETLPLPLRQSGYFVKRYENTGYTIVANRKKGVKIIDKGDKIVAKGSNLEEQALIMVEMAVAKGWDLRSVRVRGSEEFKQIVKRLIEERLATNAPLFSLAPVRAEVKTPNEPIGTKLRENFDRRKREELDFKALKELLRPEELIKFLEEKGYVERGKYDVDEKGKIKTEKRSYNIVDFCLKELNLSFKETSELLNEAYGASLESFKQGEAMSKIDWDEVKRTLNPLALAMYYGIKIDRDAISRIERTGHWKIKVGRQNRNVIDFLRTEKKMSLKEIAEEIPKILEFQKNNHIPEIPESELKERAYFKDRLLKLKTENLAKILAGMGYWKVKNKSSRNYAVMENKDGDRVVVYRKDGKYLYFNPQQEKDRGDLYDFFKNRGDKNYQVIVEKTERALKAVETGGGVVEIKIGEAKYSYSVDRALTEWERYGKQERNYAYLAWRGIDENIVETYAKQIRTDEEGNILTPMYRYDARTSVKFAFSGYVRKMRIAEEGKPKAYVNGKKGLTILQNGLPEVAVVCESFIDGLSFVQLKKLDPEKTAIVATNGQVGENDIETLRSYFDELERRGAKPKIVLAFDNDEAGREFERRIAEALKGRDNEVIVMRPNAKDWNEELLAKNEQTLRRSHTRGIGLSR
jgi:predicted RNA binding protein YcfA (HicA-like mRNA interferase family)